MNTCISIWLTITISHPSYSVFPQGFDVFLSYKHERKSIQCADEVYEHLTHFGFKVYRDSNELLGGVNISEEISAAISNAPLFLPILSSQYMGEPGKLWCQNELAFAIQEKRKLLPVVLKGANIPGSILLIVGAQRKRIEYDLFEPSTGLESITKAVEAITHRKRLSEEGMHV